MHACIKRIAFADMHEAILLKNRPFPDIGAV